MGIINDNKYKVEKFASYLKHYGVVRLAGKAVSKLIDRDEYESRWQELVTDTETLNRQKQEWFSYMPMVSILVPVFNPPKEYLKEMLLSVINQTYFRWQLCIVDAGDEKLEDFIAEVTKNDERIKYQAIENKGIAGNTNVALEMARGDYIALLDNDDIITPDALYRMVEMINKENCDCVYSDEDKVDSNNHKHFRPHIKPDFNKILLSTNNYICHLFMVKADIARQVGGFSSEYDGAQDFDFILRCTEKSNKVGHVSQVLYNWRTHQNSTSANPLSKKYAYESGKKAIESYMKRQNISGEVRMLEDCGFYAIDYTCDKTPKVEIVVLGVNESSIAKEYFRYLRKNTDYFNMGICACKEPDEKKLCDIECEYYAVIMAGTLIENKDWLKKLVAICENNKLKGAAGKLIIDNYLGYAGIKKKDAFGNIYQNAGKPSWYKGYFNHAILQSNITNMPKTGIIVKKEEYLSSLREKKPLMSKDNEFAYEPNVVFKRKK